MFTNLGQGISPAPMIPVVTDGFSKSIRPLTKKDVDRRLGRPLGRELEKMDERLALRHLEARFGSRLRFLTSPDGPKPLSSPVASRLLTPGQTLEVEDYAVIANYLN